MPEIFVFPRQIALDDDGDPISGALLYFFQTGTTTPQAVYIDAALTTPHANPIVADSAGVFPKIYLNSAALDDYRVRLVSANGVQRWQEDDISRFIVSETEIGRALYPRTTAEQLAQVTPSSYLYPESNVKRYGALGDRIADDLAAFDRAAAVAVYTKKVFIPALQAGYYYKLSNVWTLGSSLRNVTVYGEGIQSLLLIANGSGANCITLNALTHGLFKDFGIYGTLGCGHGVELTNSSHRNILQNLWCGWVDGDAFKNTLGISNTYINCRVDQNNGFRPASLVGLTDGSVKRAFYVPSTVTGLNNNPVFIGCHADASGETMSVQIGDNGGTPVFSFVWSGGLIQGSANHREVYLVTVDSLIDGAHIEPPVGTSSNWVVTLDNCTNTEIRNCGVQGDVRMIGTCVQSGMDKVRGYGLDISATSDRCYWTNGQYANNTTGPGAGAIKDRSGTAIISNLKNAANARYAAGIDVRNATTYLQSNMETWVGGDPAPTVPCGFTSFGTPTITRTSTAADVRSGTYAASVAHSSDLDEGFQVQLQPINQFAGRTITVEAWVKNVTTAGLAYIGMSEGGTGISVYQPSYQADVYERMLVTFKVDPAATTVTLKFTGLTGTVKWDSIKISCEEHQPVIVKSFDGTTTPSVSYGGQPVPYLITQGTPTITNFLDPHIGRPFVIRFDGATVISDNTNIQLAGAGNYTGAVGDMMALVYCDDGKFRQIAPEATL